MLDATLIGLSGVLLALTFDDFMAEGMIFNFWGKHLDAHEDNFWLKPLGGCIVCTTVWAVIVMGVFYLWVHPLWMALMAIGLGNFLLTLYLKYIA